MPIVVLCANVSSPVSMRVANRRWRWPCSQPTNMFEPCCHRAGTVRRTSCPTRIEPYSGDTLIGFTYQWWGEPHLHLLTRTIHWAPKRLFRSTLSGKSIKQTDCCSAAQNCASFQLSSRAPCVHSCAMPQFGLYCPCLSVCVSCLLSRSCVNSHCLTPTN